MSVTPIEIISKISDFEKLETMRNNILAKDAMEPEIESALSTRFSELGRLHINKKTGLGVFDLSPAEEKIVSAVAKYVGLLRSEGKYASRTFQMLANRGLIESAEESVCKPKPTQGFDLLEQSNLRSISFEQIVVDHPDEFTPRAIWYARKVLGMPNSSKKPPAANSLPTQVRTEKILNWLKKRAIENNGVLTGYSNVDIGNLIEKKKLSIHGRDLGNITSRIDFACYKCGVPPLGLVADQSFPRAWDQEDRAWAYPIEMMRSASQHRVWTEYELDQVLTTTKELPGRAYISWRQELEGNEQLVQDWAFGFSSKSVRRAEPPPSTVSRKDVEQMSQLEKEALLQTPKQKTRTSKTIERGSIGKIVKRANNFKCQICEALDEPVYSFVKRNGTHYVEAHHVIPVSELQIGTLAASNIMTLCANHHRQMHYGNVKVEIRDATFHINLDDKDFEISRPAIT